VRANELVLNCPSVELRDVPQNGVAKLDLFALRVAVERQRDAIGRVRNATTVKGRLRELLLNPASATPPEALDSIDEEWQEVLDPSQREALCAALGADDMFVVQGPPGTGKTQFITALIAEAIRRKPKARILLTSQTHVAIDNALERLGKRNVCSRILRIARTQGARVADAAEPYLLGNQMRAWRTQVQKSARDGLAQWAARHGIDATEMVVGALTRQIAELRTRLDRHRERIQSEEGRRGGLERLKGGVQNTALQVELDQVKDELQTIREDLDADKKQLALLEEELKQSRADAADLINLTPAEQHGWADVLVGDHPTRQLAERIMKLQGEWLNRFGTSDAFIAPLVETSSVVASTCVGLAAVGAVDEVTFDLCIIDEASKATAMESCVPMARARKWVLLGDSKQLPPFREEVLARPELRERFGIESPEAAESMFERLTKMLPATNQAMLSIQYRMVEPIGRLISNCFYNQALVSHRKLVDPVLCGVTGYAVNWMSTRELLRREEQPAGTSYVNPEEAAKISDLLLDVDDRLAEAKIVGKKSVLVLSAYGAQVSHLERRLRNIRHKLLHLEVECCTVDRVQGREADVVMFSVTRCNNQSRAGFLRALERINVALSRARDLLMIIGDDSFVQRAENAEPLRRVYEHMNKWKSECFLGVFEDRQ
jgi:superfamily I DNA and/or RNA helicase